MRHRSASYLAGRSDLYGPWQNVNTVDVIMPAWPVLLYTNPVLGKYLLLGLFEYQATGQWPRTYAVHDLGEVLSPETTTYPYMYRLHIPQGYRA